MKFLLPVIFLSVACSSSNVQLSEKAKDLEVYGNKPQNCRVTGKVVGEDRSGSIELAQNHALNQAAKLDSTGIYINQEVSNGPVMRVHATAYQCD